MIPDVVKSRLKYVRVSDPTVDLRRFPDFLIVGPQRTGTTWLHEHLRFHPDILLAEPKELFFFSRLTTPTDRRFVSNEVGWYVQFFRDPLWLRVAKTAICLRRFGALYRPRVRGEATASYAALEPAVIDDIVTLNPEIKVIMMIREPVDRAWSHAKKDLVRNRGRRFEDVSADEFREFFNDPYQRRCAQFVENCDHWAACVKPGRLFVALFDDVAARPEALLLATMEFLGVRAERRFIGADVRESVNPTESSSIPPEHRAHLEALLRQDVENLRTRFGLSWPLPPRTGPINLMARSAQL